MDLRCLLVAACAGLFALTCFQHAGASELNPAQDAAVSLRQAREEIELGKLDVAEVLLERVLMLQPENAEARVELALLMARRGQVDASRGLLQGLVEDPRTPLEHKARLFALLAGLQSQAAPPFIPVQPAATQRLGAGKAHQPRSGAASASPSPVWRAEASLAWSRNPLARTYLSEVTFTTPDGPVQVALSGRPQSGALVGLGLARLGDKASFEMQLQETPVAGGASSARLTGWGKVAPRLIPQFAASAVGDDWQWQVQALQGLDGSRRWLAGVSLVSAPWRWTLQHYDEATTGDRGGLLRLDLQALSTPDFTLSTHAERSASVGARRGSARIGVSAQWAFAEGWRAHFAWQAQEDLQGYNPLLANGATRKLQTEQFSLERAGSIGPDILLSLRAIGARRHSNIELFSFREAALQISLTRVWR